MCDEWKNSFVNFSEWAYKNGYDDSLSIDRIDNDGNYCPENCRWVNDYEQSNNKRNNKRITYEGQTHTLAQWCRIYDVPYKRAFYRLSKGWSFEDVIKKQKFAHMQSERKDI